MEKSGELGLVEIVHVAPEPVNYLVVFVIGSFVFSICLPVIEVDEGHPVHDHLQFMGFEDYQQFFRDDSLDSFLQSSDILLN